MTGFLRISVETKKKMQRRRLSEIFLQFPSDCVAYVPPTSRESIAYYSNRMTPGDIHPDSICIDENCIYLFCIFFFLQRPPSSSLSYSGPGNDDTRSPGSVGGTPGPLSAAPPLSQQSVDNVSEAGRQQFFSFYYT